MERVVHIWRVHIVPFQFWELFHSFSLPTPLDSSTSGAGVCPLVSLLEFSFPAPAVGNQAVLTRTYCDQVTTSQGELLLKFSLMPSTVAVSQSWYLPINLALAFSSAYH